MLNQKLIYVCSPLKGDIEINVARAKEYCKVVIMKDNIPIAPHVMYQGILNDEIDSERKTALGIGLELVKKCNEVWVFGDRVSEGMIGEINLAIDEGIFVRKIFFETPGQIFSTQLVTKL